MKRGTSLKRTAWLRSSTTVPTTAKKPRNVMRQPVNSTSDAIKNEQNCEIAQVVLNTTTALAGKAHAAIKSVAMAPSTSTSVLPRPKSAPVRNETYRRAVASLPCAICGMPGYSQAAHGSAGKGMGFKSCDLTCFPACCDRPGVRGCHSRLDQGALFSKAARHALEPVWAADTQRRIHAMGLWPKNLPYPSVALDT